MAVSKNIGIKISQLGWDVKTAGDANLYFSSSWPFLKIQSTDVLVLNGTGTTFGHGLPYPPLAFVWTPQDGLGVCSVNNNTITIPALIGSRVRYFIFGLPLNKPYQSPIVISPLEQPNGADHNFGLKFVKVGKSTKSKDYRDYTLHSSTRSPLLHAVINRPMAPIADGIYAGINGLKWKPDLPYRPVFFAFFSSDNSTFTPVYSASQTIPKLNYDTTDNGIVINDGGTTGNYGTIVLFKDPLSSPNYRAVTL